MLSYLAFALGFCLAAVAVAFAADGTDCSSTELVEVDIGDQRFAIPRPYIARIARESDGSIQFVRLSVLWPSLEPLTHENKHLWTPDLPGRQTIDIGILSRPRDGYSVLQRAIELGLLDRRVEPGPFGLDKYEKDLPEARRTMRYFTSTDEAYFTPVRMPIVFDCRDHFTWDAHRHMKLEPTCETNYSLEDGGAGLYYRFYRKNLESWLALDTAIRKLVSSFRCNKDTQS